MKTGVIGSRSFNDYNLLCNILSNYSIDEIISGGAKGADSLAIKYAKDNNIKFIEYYPDWSKGNHAGFLRNQQIVDASDIIIAFWDGKSNGTRDSIKKAKQQNKLVIVINYNLIQNILQFE